MWQISHVWSSSVDLGAFPRAEVFRLKVDVDVDVVVEVVVVVVVDMAECGEGSGKSAASVWN